MTRRRVELAVLGTALIALLGGAALAAPGGDLRAVQLWLWAAFAVYLVAVSRLRRIGATPGAFVVVAAVAVIVRLFFLPTAPTLSDDVYRFLWDGRVIAHGGDPYLHAPRDSVLAPLRDDTVYPRVNHPELATIYPPLAEAEFALLAAAGGGLAAMKGWIVAHDLAVVALLAALLRRRGLPAAAALVYAWNPLPVLEFAGNAHYEPVAMAWLLAAFLFAETRPVLAAAALAGGVLIKVAPLAALPFLWRRWPARARVVAAVLLGAGLGAWLELSHGPASGLGAYWARWENNDLLFALLFRATGAYATARTLGLLIVALVVGVLLARGRETLAATRATLRAALLAGPVAHPWYLGWLVVLEPLAPAAPWLLLSATSLLSYGVLRAPPDPPRYHLSMAGRLVEYGLPLGVGLVLSGIRARRRAVPAGVREGGDGSA